MSDAEAVLTGAAAGVVIGLSSTPILTIASKLVRLDSSLTRLESGLQAMQQQMSLLQGLVYGAAFGIAILVLQGALWPSRWRE